MGNISSMARASTALDSYVAELGNDISYDKSLSSSRFLKTILARHAYGPLVLKIFIKPDVTMSLRVIQRRLKMERDALADLHSVHAYQTFVETEKAGYLIRQWAGSNLYDRVSTQPYLANVEKKWIAFQLLMCLSEARSRKVAHGDVKSENVLITTDLTVMLTDFSASFKPTFLPVDDPSDFSFFFDTSGRRTCYIAPERFFESESRLADNKRAAAVASRDPGSGDAWGKRDGRVTEEMDVFSAGCVLAEIWTDGRTVFNLSELYAYRNDTVGLDGILDNLHDEQNMIKQMLSRDPSDRPSFDRILTDFRGTIFPEYFYTFFKEYIASLAELPGGGESTFLQRFASAAGTKIDRLLEEWESVSVHLDDIERKDNDGPALLLLNITTSSIRNCVWPSSRLHGLQLFLNLCPYLIDEDKMDRIIPFAVDLLSDDTAIVRAEACRTVVQIVESVSSITPANATFIPEYLLPMMRALSADPDVLVRATYARGLVRLAEAAVSMLEMNQANQTDKAELEASGVVEPDYDSMLLEIQAVVEEQATVLLVDPSSNVKGVMLANIANLCLFFGRQKSSETVLSHIMTYLNDRDWLLRSAFFDGIVGVGAFIGIRAIEEYILPLMLQALADAEEAVVCRVIVSMTSLAALGLLPRMRLWDVFFAVRGFLCHPNAWIRQSSAGFVSAAARNLPPSDVWCILYPALRTILQSDIRDLGEESILSALVPTLSRSALGAARSAALQNSPPGFWDSPPSGNNLKTVLRRAINGTEPSESAQLRDKGINSKDEKKMGNMKEFIAKQAHAIRAREANEQASPPEIALTAGSSVSLIELGVTPQTVFISPRTVGVDLKTDIRRLRPHLMDGAQTRQTSFANRSVKSVNNPLEEVRKRLAAADVMSRMSENSPTEPTFDVLDDNPSDSARSSTIDMTAPTRTGRRNVEGKAAPLIAASHANARGMTSIHDEPWSGSSTPIAGPSQTKASTAPYSSSYDGQDPGVRAFLEQIDLENYREPLLDFGPRIVPVQRRRAPRSKSASSQGVTMIAHLSHHNGAITSIVTSPDQLFFASASDDSLIHIWDTGRLERSVTVKPRLVHRMNASVTSMCRIENTHCLATAAKDGQLHVLRVHASVTGGSIKYGRIECIRAWTASDKEGHVVHVSHLRDSLLLLVTSTSVVCIMDIRSMNVLHRFLHPLEKGSITTVCPANHWLVIGTSTGTLSLWDLRFGLLLKSWSASGHVTASRLHPSKGHERWIMVSTRQDETDVPIVEVYDIESAKLVETYGIRSTRPTIKSSTGAKGKDPPNDRAALIAELATGRSLPGRSIPLEASQVPEMSTVLSLLVGSSFASLPPQSNESGLLGFIPEKRSIAQTTPGWLLTAGEDRVVRYWDLAHPSEGFVVCGSVKEKDVIFRQGSAAVPTLFYTLPNQNRQSVSESKHATVTTPRQPLRPHYDAICALGTAETAFSSCVISGDRSGILKVWRMEAGPGGK